jgi:hypothetical protein
VPSAGEHFDNPSGTWSAHPVKCVALSGDKGHAMKLPRRQFLHLAAGAVALPATLRMAPIWRDLLTLHLPALGPGCVKTKSDLVVTASGG